MVKPGDRLCVGLSGGLDSIVLLDVLATLAPRHRWRLSAIHVNHQLSPNAPAWAAFCRRECGARQVPLRVAKVTVARGNSTEAAAREARYEAYRACDADAIVLAHHQDDQVETLLLRLLRGAGVKGLAAMPRTRKEGHLHVVRPLLDVSRQEIEGYAKRRKLQWIEDESNTDTYYLRNFLRSEILPRVASRVPGYRATLTRAAANLADAAELLDDLALLDSRDCLRDDTLLVAGLQRLSVVRAGNLLRHFLARAEITMPDRRTLDEALRQAINAKQDARVNIDLGSHGLHRFEGALHLVRKQGTPDSGFATPWQGERSLRVAALGATLTMKPGRGGGIDLERLRAAPVTLRLRQGGERLRPDANRPRRSVKDLFQEHGVPPWMRDRLPFLWSGQHLVWVPGLGVDQRFHAATGASSITPHWQRDSYDSAP
ncbi:MAG: tRNA lysidine(34) synthetase TilS [Burkholderiales bacterium]